MCTSGLISGLVAQSELTQLLDELYANHNLLEEVYRSHSLTSLDEVRKDAGTALYSEAARILG